MSEKNLEEKIRWMEDVIEIYQVQNRYQHYLCLFMVEEIVGLFAQKQPDVSVEGGDSGHFEGIDGVRRLFQAHEKVGEEEDDLSGLVGQYFEHTAVTPIVEVAKDGKTAKGVWLSPGIMASSENNMQAWSWGKYYCDYIKEDGEWKIWHMQWRQTFEGEYEKGWLYDQECKISTMRLPPLFPPHKPTTHHMPYNPYRVNYMVPEPPEPYDSHEE